MSNNPYDTPQAELASAAPEDFVYVGFWPRAGASLIDSCWMLLITMPLLVAIYGWEYFDGDTFVSGTWDVLISYVFPAVAVLVFWRYRSATPGKMAIKAKIVDAKTGMAPSTAQLVGRYLGYYVSMLPLMLGIIWVAFDKRKQGWHDKLAGTLVVKN